MTQSTKNLICDVIKCHLSQDAQKTREVLAELSCRPILEQYYIVVGFKMSHRDEFKSFVQFIDEVGLKPVLTNIMETFTKELYLGGTSLLDQRKDLGQSWKLGEVENCGEYYKLMYGILCSANKASEQPNTYCI